MPRGRVLGGNAPTVILNFREGAENSLLFSRIWGLYLLNFREGAENSLLFSRIWGSVLKQANTRVFAGVGV